MLKSSFIKPIIFKTIPKLPKTLTGSFIISNSLLHASPTLHSQTIRTNASTTNPTSAYIHLPFCRKRCHYCDFPIVALGVQNPVEEDDPRVENYVNLLCREIDATRGLFEGIQEEGEEIGVENFSKKFGGAEAEKTHFEITLSEENLSKNFSRVEAGNTHIETTSELKTVFFGGGTPSLVPPRLVRMILENLSKKFGICKNAEVSIEMDPGTFNARKLNGLLEIGVNRVSLGVQAFQDELLRSCGRAHGLEEVYEAVRVVKECGVENWSMDLISSLPHQTVEMWEESLRLAVEMGPKHVSVYDLQVEQGTKFGTLYKPGEFPLPSEYRSAEFYKMASSYLSNAGYEHYEISSYGKEGYKCKHNVTYWDNKPYYAFGLGSASYLKGVRFSRPRKMKDYTNYVKELEDGVVDHHNSSNIDPKDLALDILMLSLRTSAGLDVKSFKQSFGTHIVVSLCKAFRPYIESGHVMLLDEKRKAFCQNEFRSMLSSEHGFEEVVAFVRLSDPEGFLLSNELIAIAFGVISP